MIPAVIILVLAPVALFVLAVWLWVEVVKAPLTGVIGAVGRLITVNDRGNKEWRNERGLSTRHIPCHSHPVCTRTCSSWSLRRS